MDSIIHFVCQHFDTAILFTVITILGLAVIVLTGALLNKEKAMQLKDFTIGTLGVQLQYEINKDEKMKILVAENIILRKEIEILKESVKALESDRKNTNIKMVVVAIGVMLLFMFVLYFDRIKRYFKKDEKTPDSPPPPPITPNTPFTGIDFTQYLRKEAEQPPKPNNEDNKADKSEK